MKLRALLSALLLLTAASVRAQFIGDSLAAAGYNITEQEALDSGLASISRTAPRESANQSSVTAPRASTNTSVPQPVRPITPTSPSSITSEPGSAPVSATPSEAPLASLSPQPEGAAYGIAGGGKTYTAEEVAEWKSAFRPVGTTVASLPSDCETVEGAAGAYKYCKGVFYRQQGSGWTAVPAPVGARVKDRPAGGSLIVYKGSPYTYYNGAFFVWNSSAKAADVVKAPVGAIVTNIPETAVKQDQNGKACYVHGNTCFVPTFRGTSVVYVIG